MLSYYLYEGMPVVGVEAQCCGLPIFFSKNITEETSACDLAYYIGLEKNADVWAEKIVPIVEKNILARRSYVNEIKEKGFDSSKEAQRLQKFYQEKMVLE